MKKQNIMTVIVERKSGSVRKKQIKKATLEILFQEGVKRLLTKNITTHAHLSEGVIFHHFHSKKENSN